VVLAWSTACGESPPERPPNVLLVSFDTLRADRVGSYGYDKPITPSLDALAARGVVFERAYSPAPSTLLAHASLLTGLQPDVHSVLAMRDVLSEEITTLAQPLRAAGYRTGAFVNCGWLLPSFGFDRGFVTYDFSHDLAVHRKEGTVRFGRDAQETNRAIITWLEDYPWDHFFLFVHYFDVHSDWQELPYEAPPEWQSRFAVPRPEGFRSGDGEVTASAYLVRMNEQGIRWSSAERAYVESLYDAGVGYVDAAFGQLLAKLEELDLLDDTLVIVVADHGEEFQEHGQVLHDQVYEEDVRIPLIVAFPPRDPGMQKHAGSRWGGIVELVDVVPTVLDYLGIEAPKGLQGRSLLEVLEEKSETNRRVFFRTQIGEQVGMREGRHKLVHQRNSGRTLLFDLDADPHEQVDLAAREPETVARLLRSLAEWQSEARAHRLAPGVGAEPDPSIVEALRALGYAVD